MYGTKYHENIVETLRKSAELCDCLQSFFILHSMGGGGCGTWSRDSHVTWLTHRDWVRSWYKNPRGFERRIPWSLQVCFLRKIENWKWKHCFRFVVAVFPSADDDVITSPYNRLMKKAFTERKKFKCSLSLISVLALHELTEKADCVLPIDNQVIVHEYSLFMKQNLAASLKLCTEMLIFLCFFSSLW